MSYVYFQNAGWSARSFAGEINGGTVPVPQCAAYAADEDADKHGGGLGVIVRVGGGQAVLGECSSRGGSGWRG